MARQHRFGQELPATPPELVKHKSKAALQPYETPKILWTEKLQTLAYTCDSGPAPVSGTTCPPS